MDLEAIKQKLSRATKFQWNGDDVWLRKIGASDGLSFFAKIKELQSTELSETQDREATLDYYARAIAMSLCSEDGTLVADSDEGIATLKLVNFHELINLGDMVLRHSGFRGDDEKKTLPQSDLQLSGSVSNSDSGPTPTTFLIS